MVHQAILTASLFLLLAFGIERLGRSTGIPSVILLIVTGIAGKPVLASLGITLDGIDSIVPTLGTIGLILIVLEGALDIELRRERLRAATGAFLMAIVGFSLCTSAFALAGHYLLALPIHQALIMAIPCAVISSAVAIPSASFLPPQAREFVVYESSISDIIGVLAFFSLLGADGSLAGAATALIGGGILSLLLAAVFSIGLVLTLVRIDGHIRFIPLLAGLFGLYSAGKLFHLSPLILVLLFGLTLNNPFLISRIPLFKHWLDESYSNTLKEFKTLTQELTFAVRGFFFILLGYWANLSDLATFQAWLTATVILLVIYSSRYLLRPLLDQPSQRALIWLAPRGLITVLLYINAKEVLSLPGYLDGAVMIVVITSSALVTLGRMGNTRNGAEKNGAQRNPA